jgi:glycosyltransferase involved in cell wall biosynthesis
VSPPLLLVDGRVLDDDYPGVRGFWVPVLCAWADLGGRGLVAHRRGCAPEAKLMAAGFSPIELHHSPYDPRGVFTTRSIVRRSAATATLSPLYLTIDGAPRNVGTIFDLIGRTHARSLPSRLLWEVVIRRATHAASGIVCATAAARNVILRAFPGLRDRIFVVSAVAPRRPYQGETVAAGVAGPYALSVASHRPHKRLAALAAAWRAGGSAVPLVMLGVGTERLNAPPDIRGLGFVSDAEVDSWLGGAACLVSSSSEEGFGLPILAALAWGVPIVATRHPALEEVAGDAGTWVEADDIDGLVREALAVLAASSTSAARIERGRQRAGTFTASQAAQQLARAIE